ncbi:MAG: hypothetical protein GY862_07310 [Gammaproteobacteria bacterium]|nr:hypothetical protein [Gammaproteobacteria bacterium]
MKDDIAKADFRIFHPLPRYLDLQSLGDTTPALLFERIYQGIVQDIQDPVPWVRPQSGREYEYFLAQTALVKSRLDACYGPDWLLILLVDELDNAIDKLPNDQFFQNLRNLLMVSDFRRHFRLVATGVGSMARLILSGSPLNNLRRRYLGILDKHAARQLILAGFKDGLPAGVEAELYRISGRHPYLLQGLLEKLWDLRGGLEKGCVYPAGRAFLKEHGDFHSWLEHFGPVEHEIYRRLCNTDTAGLEELQRELHQQRISDTDEAVNVLAYHGVIDDSDEERICIAGMLFRDWYRLNVHLPEESEPPTESVHKSKSLLPETKQALIELLLECPAIQDEETRRILLAELPPHIREAVKTSNNIKVHVLNIVNACMTYEDGIEHLLDALRFFDGKTRQFQKLTAFINPKEQSNESRF